MPCVYLPGPAPAVTVRNTPPGDICKRVATLENIGAIYAGRQNFKIN